jgi:TonB family protein
LTATPVLAASPTPELQRAIRSSTFEVVMKKPDADPLTYEKPLPLDLLPYSERTDAYRSVGTAFALGQNRYVTAAHVLLAGAGSQYGAPALRGADGAVHEIDQILKFSAHQDFVLFSLKDAPDPPGFAVGDPARVDDPVMAVGNALGDGIVIRDGLYTSSTPEQQDGRWNWIRFSAAASPGNSGGPLLDASGRVIGIVIGKSPNENLNYALPIRQALEAPDRLALFDQRALISMPYLQGTQTYSYKDQFALPLGWMEFARAYLAVIERHDRLSRSALLTSFAETLFPGGGDADSLLYSTDANDFNPRLVTQQPDGSWTATAPDYTSTDLPGDGSVSVASVAGVTLVRLERPGSASDDAFYSDSRGFMDLALKGLNLRRPVGADQVRITSLGPARSEKAHVDQHGRRWQQRVWAVPFLDVYLDVWLLPTPDGYSGFIQYVPSMSLTLATDRSRALADLFDVSLRGTVAQWRAHLARRDALPEVFSGVKLETGGPWSISTGRFVFTAPPELLAVSDQSILTVTMGFLRDDGRIRWDIHDVWWYRDVLSEASLGLIRRLQPPITARRDLRSTFDYMRNRRPPFSADLDRESSTVWSLAHVLDVPADKPGMVAADVLYSVLLRMDSFPGSTRVTYLREQLGRTTRILETRPGEGMAPGRSSSTAAVLPVSAAFEAFSKDHLDRAAELSNLLGKDLRGRTFQDDVRDTLEGIRPRFGQPGVDMDELGRGFLRQGELLIAYWKTVPALMSNRDLWGAFLLKNQLPAGTPHGPEVLAAERALTAMLGDGVPSEDWATSSAGLTTAYIQERRMAVADSGLKVEAWRPRASPCPPPATATSGSASPKFGTMKRSPDEFYPPESRRKAVAGTVLLSVRIAASGCAEGFAVAGSSGEDALDDAALQFAGEMEFLPAERDGEPVEALYEFKVSFQLKE